MLKVPDWSVVWFYCEVYHHGRQGQADDPPLGRARLDPRIWVTVCA